MTKLEAEIPRDCWQAVGPGNDRLRLLSTNTVGRRDGWLDGHENSSLTHLIKTHTQNPPPPPNQTQTPTQSHKASSAPSPSQSILFTSVGPAPTEPIHKVAPRGPQRLATPSRLTPNEPLPSEHRAHSTQHFDFRKREPHTRSGKPFQIPIPDTGGALFHGGGVLLICFSTCFVLFHLSLGGGGRNGTIKRFLATESNLCLGLEEARVRSMRVVCCM